MTETYDNRPLVIDEKPLDDGATTINVWVRQGDELATMRVTQLDTEEDEHGEEIEVETDTSLTAEELLNLGMTAGKALIAIGKRADLAELIKGLTDVLLEGK